MNRVYLENGIYKTGTGQALRTHDKRFCRGEHCVIHNPSDHHMKDWRTHWRGDRGMMERICPHGVGHPDPDDVAFIKFHKGEKYAETYTVHGCDGCCKE